MPSRCLAHRNAPPSRWKRKTCAGSLVPRGRRRESQRKNGRERKEKAHGKNKEAIFSGSFAAGRGIFAAIHDVSAVGRLLSAGGACTGCFMGISCLPIVKSPKEPSCTIRHDVRAWPADACAGAISGACFRALLAKLDRHGNTGVFPPIFISSLHGVPPGSFGADAGDKNVAVVSVRMALHVQCLLDWLHGERKKKIFLKGRAAERRGCRAQNGMDRQRQSRPLKNRTKREGSGWLPSRFQCCLLKRRIRNASDVSMNETAQPTFTA